MCFIRDCTFTERPQSLNQIKEKTQSLQDQICQSKLRHNPTSRRQWGDNGGELLTSKPPCYLREETFEWAINVESDGLHETSDNARILEMEKFIQISMSSDHRGFDKIELPAPKRKWKTTKIVRDVSGDTEDTEICKQHCQTSEKSR
ncbi:hypothetical protein PoB_000987500 [Plakobranchus ocellatus]|uniref:Uncharacterized protein n=1 Tax=Plakobranchus ocellatus TaxID=259542 RepID=A0AAV3YKV2_9GAST|nr:hypothetical protein PoB_000987500 [Plakobranchus ocellatus]